EPFNHDAHDGYDVVEWLSHQPYCDGQVAMWGGSYAGFDQWTTLKEFPPHLKTIVPAAAAKIGFDVPAYKNIFSCYMMRWLTLTSGVTPNSRLFAESSFWNSKYRELYLQHRPYRELDVVVGNPCEHFQSWVRHPTPEVYDVLAPSAEQYA